MYKITIVVLLCAHVSLYTALKICSMVKFMGWTIIPIEVQPQVPDYGSGNCDKIYPVDILTIQNTTHTVPLAYTSDGTIWYCLFPY